MTKLIAIVFMLGGISILPGLWPLPPQMAQEYRAQVATALMVEKSTDGTEASHKLSDFLPQSIEDDPNFAAWFWLKWLVTLSLILCCVGAGILMLLQVRFWAIVVLVCTAFYAWDTEFFLPIYSLFFYGITSSQEFSSRIAIVVRHPQVLAAIFWFNLVLPLAFSVASIMAIKSLSGFSRIRIWQKNLP